MPRADAGEAPIVQVRHLTRTYGSKDALIDVSHQMPPGYVFGLLGGSGAGKTTLLRHLLGLMKSQDGTVLSALPILPLFSYPVQLDRWRTMR